MDKLDRRSALALFGLLAASAAGVKPAASQTMDTAGKDTTLWPGVVQRAYGETSSIIPGFKTVSMRDIIVQPGSKTMAPPMMNAMVCHITEGELRIEQEAKTFTAKKDSSGPATRTQTSKRLMTGASLPSCGSQT